MEIHFGNMGFTLSIYSCPIDVSATTSSLGAPRLPHAPRSPEPPQLMKTLLDDRLQDCEVYDEVIFTSCSNDHLPNKAVSMSKVQSAGRIHSSGQQSTKSLGAGVLMKLYSPERKNMAGSVSEQRGVCNAARVCVRG